MPRTRTDAELICRDCGGPLDFSSDERQSFANQGHLHPPSRCAACRATRKSRQAESGMPSRAPQFRELRETRTTIACSACHQPATVPFAVRPDRPVYCSACFQQRRYSASA